MEETAHMQELQSVRLRGGSRILGDQGLSPEGADADLFFPSFFVPHTQNYLF